MDSINVPQRLPQSSYFLEWLLEKPLVCVVVFWIANFTFAAE